VRDGAPDIAFADVTEAESEPDLAIEKTRTSQMLFYCRVGHPLQKKDRLTLDDLLAYP
jgi:hypothetical protein